MRRLRFLATALCLATGVSCTEPRTTTPEPPPEPPTGLVATAPEPDRVDLGWTHAGPSITQFRIERRTGTGAFAQIATAVAAARIYADATLAPETTYEYRLRACAAERCSDHSSSATATTPADTRATADRPDDISGPQVHVLYVVPQDGQDRRLDADGTIATSVASFHNWFMQRAVGMAIRFDTHEGELDVGFFRLSTTDAQTRAFGAFVVTEIERQLDAAGRLVPDKKYLVYYDGGSTWACGGAAWPPVVPGQVAAMYLKGTPAGFTCGSQGFVTSPTQFPGYWEFAALHDLIHTLGIVSANAPNHTTDYPAHVPEPHDLMYAGPSPWALGPSLAVDVGGDDYFGDDVPAGVANLRLSPYLTTAVVAALPAVDPPAPGALAALLEAGSRLPPHPPLALTLSRY